jgi:serine/threonine protein kinase
MGIVYRAQDPTIGRIIAIKSIRLNEFTDAEERTRLRERLFREAQSAGILSHPNIVTIYDILEEDGLAYIFMEFVNGQPLDDILRSPQLPPNFQLIELLSQTGNALDYAHKKGIIHRDVKPANVMVHEETVAKVCDFGIAKITSQSMTQTGVVMGTPSYMSPELIKGETLTGASDQFALAIMAYEILTGRKPFTADYLPTLFFKVCSDEPPAVHELNPTLGPLVDRAVRKALAKKPEDRYSSCVEFITVLQRSLAGTPDWTPMAKGPMPILEETTTGSGGRLATMPATPAAAHQPPAAAALNTQETIPVPAAPTLPPEPAIAVVASQTLPPTPAPPPQAPEPPPVVEATLPSMRIPIREMEAARIQSPGGTNKGLVAGLAVAALVIAGYFGYSQFAAKPVTEMPPPDPAVTQVPSPPADGKKATTPKASDLPGKLLPAQNPPAPVSVNPPPKPVPPTDPPKPAGGKDFEFAFTTAPAGATVTVDRGQTCTSPCNLRLTPGRHGVQISLAGFLTTFKTIEVPQSLDLFAALPEATGILTISSTPPGATIIVDGKTRSEKTPAKLTLREGLHKIEIVSGSLRDTHDVTIKQGAIHQIQSQW